jgi:universal stress protein A
LVRHGSAEREISDFAAAREIDLVVASTHEHSRMKRALFGGLTERIVHHSPCPILIVREHEHEFVDASTIRIKRILAPADFSDCSKKALRYALAFAGQYGAEITCLHVMEPEKPKIIFETEAYEKTQRVEAERKFKALVNEFDAGNLKCAFITGVPHKSIVEAADKDDADLIILGEHCRTGVFGRFMMGSTTDEVVKHAHCPILVVRQNEHEFVG